MVQADSFCSCEGVEDVCRYDRLTRVKRRGRAKKVPRRNNLQQAAQQACLLKLKTCGEFWGNEDAKFRTASASVLCSHDAVISSWWSENRGNVVMWYDFRFSDHRDQLFAGEGSGLHSSKERVG